MNTGATQFKLLLTVCITLQFLHICAAQVEQQVGKFMRPERYQLFVTNDTPFSIKLQSQTSAMPEMFLPRESRKITPTSLDTTFRFSLFCHTFMKQPSKISFATCNKQLIISQNISCFDIFIVEKQKELLIQIPFEETSD